MQIKFSELDYIILLLLTYLLHGAKSFYGS